MKCIWKNDFQKAFIRSVFMAFIMLIVSFSANAQQEGKTKDSLYRKQMGRERPISTIIKTSIFSPFFWQLPATGEYRLVGEYMFNKNQSVQLGASYLTRSIFFALLQKMAASSGAAKVAMNGYRIQGAYKYYFYNRKFRPEGFYLAIHSSFASVKANFKDYPDDYQLLEHFNISLLIGGQVIIRNRVSIEIFMGPGFKNNSYISRARNGYGVFIFEELGSSYYSHFKLTTGINMGIVL
jgi:hypothetical protein